MDHLSGPDVITWVHKHGRSKQRCAVLEDLERFEM